MRAHLGEQREEAAIRALRDILEMSVMSEAGELTEADELERGDGHIVAVDEAGCAEVEARGRDWEEVRERRQPMVTA